MLNSAITILAEYIDGVTPYNFYSLLMERGENGEDIYYLCEIGTEFYVVLETDYVDSRPYQAQEAAEIFGMEPLGWVAKRAERSADDRLIPLDAEIGKASNYEMLVLSREGTYLRHAVLKMRDTAKHGHRYNPNTYGFTTK